MKRIKNLICPKSKQSFSQANTFLAIDRWQVAFDSIKMHLELCAKQLKLVDTGQQGAALAIDFEFCLSYAEELYVTSLVSNTSRPF